MIYNVEAHAEKHYIDVTAHKVAIPQCNLCSIFISYLLDNQIKSKYLSESQRIFTLEASIYFCYEKRNIACFTGECIT